MKSPTVIKVDDIQTPIGTASLLQINNKHLLSFPEVINRDCKIALETHYGTLLWPSHLPLSRISEFPPGPALPGYLLTSLEDMFAEQSTPKTPNGDKRPRHVREFLSNVLAGIAASLLIALNVN